MSIEEYLDRLTEQIRFRRARAAIREEVRGHLEDQIEAYLEEGADEEAAREKAILEMGDPVETGAALDRIHRPGMDWKTIAVAGFLGIAGLLIQYFLQTYFGDTVYPEIDFGKQFLYLALSFGVMLAVCWLDYSRIGRHARAIYLVLMCLLLASSSFAGAAVDGASRWISLPLGFWLNTTTMVLLSVPLYGAILYSWRGQGYTVLLKGLLWMLPAFVVAMAGNSFYTVLLLFLSFTAVLMVAVYKEWFSFPRKKGLALVGAGAVLLPAAGLWYGLYCSSGYLAERLEFYLLLTRGPVEDASWLTTVQQKILDSSRWIGAAYTQPQDWMTGVSNYTLTYTIAYYGILAGIILTGILALLFLGFYRRAIHQKNQMGMLMGVGCSVVFLGQLLLYVAENLALIPPCGSYCPFLTYGGNGMLVTFVLLGLMLSIYRYRDVFPGERHTEKLRISC